MTKRLLLIIILLFFAAWLPRVLGLDHFVTADEPKWLAASGNFSDVASQVYQAISHGELANTFQSGQPGVTVLWAGTLALYENSHHTPLDLLVASRWWMVFFISSTLALSYLPLRRLLGERVAVLALLFVSWDPFHLALSRLLHPEGLAAALGFLALTSFLVWLFDNQPRRYLIFSALVMGLASLTKLSAILLVPVTGLFVAVESWRAANTTEQQRQQDTKTQTDKDSSSLVMAWLAWALLSLLVFVIFWPAMWVEPFGTLSKMVLELGSSINRHVKDNYFFGQPTPDPGPIFYPVAYLFRTTPIILIGLRAAYLLVWPRDEENSLEITTQVRQTIAALFTFALIFTLIMTVGTQKFDRYLLPIFLPLDVVAALGWIALAQWLNFRNKVARSRWLMPVGLSLVLILHALPGFLTYPYYLTYYNPLVGGSMTAPKALLVGSGEGLEQAAAWLNQQPDAENLRVTSWHAEGAFSYFFRGQSINLTSFSPMGWLESDFMVLYVEQWQRELPTSKKLAWFFEQQPTHIVKEDGLELARIYDLRDAPLPDFLGLKNERRADFGGQIRLSAVDLPKESALPGERFRVTFYERSLAPMEINYNVLVRLVAADGSELWRHEGWPYGAPTSNWPLRDHRPDGHEIVIPEEATAGLYALTLSFYNPTTLEPLSVTEVNSESSTGERERVIDFIRIGSSPRAARPLKPAPQFGEVALLKGVTLPESVEKGSTLNMALEWESVAHTPHDYTVFVHLVAPDGTLVAQQDRQPLNGFAPTHLWDALRGESFLDEYQIPISTDIAPARYEVRVGLYTAESGRLPVRLAGQEAADFVTIGSVMIR